MKPMHRRNLLRGATLSLVAGAGWPLTSLAAGAIKPEAERQFHIYA